jgi:hypothetical protein
LLISLQRSYILAYQHLIFVIRTNHQTFGSPVMSNGGLGGGDSSSSAVEPGFNGIGISNAGDAIEPGGPAKPGSGNQKPTNWNTTADLLPELFRMMV